jgi:hypothetical protein
MNGHPIFHRGKSTSHRQRPPRPAATRATRALVVAAMVIALGVVLGNSAGAVLPGSTFEGDDGNFVVNTAGNTDWANAPNRHVGQDAINSQQDNSFGQGTSENDVNVTVIAGSIPNSKADLAQFLEANEQVAGGDIFLYLGWTRANQSGTTNFDFEINQADQPDLTTPGPKTLARTAGDLLINYLFQGQGTPVINLRTWTGTEWSAATPLATPIAEAAINTASVPNPFGSPTPLPAGQFGELAVNLTDAGVFPPGVCKAFGSAYVKSRASTSFQSEVKDFVAPVDINISNCSRIIVVKQTVPSPDPSNTSFPFVASYDADGFSLTNGQSNDSGEINPGTYSVAETPVPANWDLTSATCDDGSDPAAIDLGPAETVTCTFVNTLQTGAILIHKDRKHAADGSGNHPHAGVAFAINGTAAGTTDASGNICVDGLTFGTYTVNETVPTGYVSDDASKDVVVDNSATCEQDPYVGETVNFVNTPLTDITVSVNSQVDGGTASTIDCVVANASTGPTGDGSLAVSDLPPGTYTCTIVVDP